MFDDVIQQSHLRREEEEILFNKGVADSNTSVYSLTKKKGRTIILAWTRILFPIRVMSQTIDAS